MIFETVFLYILFKKYKKEVRRKQSPICLWSHLWRVPLKKEIPFVEQKEKERMEINNQQTVAAASLHPAVIHC